MFLRHGSVVKKECVNNRSLGGNKYLLLFIIIVHTCSKLKLVWIVENPILH